jgi:hypothetical protein
MKSPSTNALEVGKKRDLVGWGRGDTRSGFGDKCNRRLVKVARKARGRNAGEGNRVSTRAMGGFRDIKRGHWNFDERLRTALYLEPSVHSGQWNEEIACFWIPIFQRFYLKPVPGRAQLFLQNGIRGFEQPVAANRSAR